MHQLANRWQQHQRSDPASLTLTPVEKHQREFSGIFSKRRAGLSFPNSGDRKAKGHFTRKELGITEYIASVSHR